MKKEYRVFCKCIEDIIKFLECTSCPHYRRNVEKYCSYGEKKEEE